VVWLGLESDFDRVEGIFDVLADDAGYLVWTLAHRFGWEFVETR
jgi:hypothetical protein